MNDQKLFVIRENEKNICDACGGSSDYLNGYCRDCEVNENGIYTEKENEQETESGDE